MGFRWWPALMGLILASAQPAFAAAPKTVESPPLSSVLAKTAVGEVAAGTTQVPLITWGGDIATILANGNATRTVAGSAFAAEGLDLNLVREDVFAKQVDAYMTGRSPYLRGTLGMINMAADLLNKDPRTRPVVIYQMTWSAGGDTLVVKQGIGSARDLKGKTIALQAYGPHVDYLTKILGDAGLSPSDVKIRWLADLTGTDDTPMRAFQQKDVDAAFVITPDALVLTSGGTVGSGAEDSVKGARILLSTKTANKIIADVYAVRSDYLAKNRKAVESFVHGLMAGEEKLRALMAAKPRGPEFKAAMAASAKILLDSEQAAGDAEGLYGDAEFVGHRGNVEFFATPGYPRNLDKLDAEIQAAFSSMGLASGSARLAAAGWDYAKLAQGLSSAGKTAEATRFDENQVAAVVTRKQQQGTLADGELFSFEIFFQPNQNGFSADLYQEAFAKVVDLASTYGGALITVEGHSDPMAYLRDKKAGKPDVVLGQIKQAAKNLSLSRAVAVRDSVLAYAQAKGVSLDASQFAVVGHGIANPKSGLCGSDPCAPKNEREWRDNMRVQFRIIQVEAESSVFKPL
ncbi:MAG: ABC-type nitrate/sulfonate/bicarbonate transport system, periplasmic component [Hydrocarboniphaga sp.]|uniref:ABC transporter substrate-binding protein n=1 Tax=Hydrocarboniphaga sp. TaxID=2033016 RepID=UPI0026367F5F|nr:ABC transporter substrate-binding protein [Hydrocarboniphaga sp.]MDB5973147.1 ABC-type nitrate/sulfonate/bicarbonate transport system, periplasmic component [Hydrocarboniphaga sp.]